MSMLMFAEKTQVESREALESDSPPASAPQGLGFEDTLPDEHPPWLERIGRLARNELLEISKDLVKLRQQPQRRWFISGAFARWRHFILEMRRRGHTEGLIRKIVYENPLEFFGQSLQFNFRHPD